MKVKKEYTKKQVDEVFKTGFKVGHEVATKGIIEDLEEFIKELKAQEGIE